MGVFIRHFHPVCPPKFSLCTDVPPPSEKIDFFLREGGCLYTGYLNYGMRKHCFQFSGAPNVKFSENICSADDLGSRIFGTFVVKFLACMPLLGFSKTKKWYNCPFLTDLYPKLEVT